MLHHPITTRPEEAASWKRPSGVAPSPALCLLPPGSSIGSWVALHLALAHPQRVAGLVLLAPAVDYSEINWARLDEGQRQKLQAGEEIPFGSGGEWVGVHLD